MAPSSTPAVARFTALALATLGLTGPTSGGDAEATSTRVRVAAAEVSPSTLRPQDPIHPYDGSWTFVRIRTSGYGRFGRFGGYGAGWAHDYPDAERNFSRIVAEFTKVDARLVPDGGNILTFEDPRLHAFPIAYVSEPDEWRTTEEEAGGLRENDKRRRMLAIAGAGADIGDLWEWSDRGYFPVDPTNEAYGIGINYLIYALTH